MGLVTIHFHVTAAAGRRVPMTGFHLPVDHGREPGGIGQNHVAVIISISTLACQMLVISINRELLYYSLFWRRENVSKFGYTYGD